MYSIASEILFDQPPPNPPTNTHLRTVQIFRYPFLNPLDLPPVIQCNPLITSPPKINVIFLQVFNIYLHGYVIIFCYFLIIVTTPTTTQPQHCSWVGHENKCKNPTTPLHHHTNSTAPEQHSLLTTKYSGISNNKQGYNNNNNNKIISFRSLRLTFIESNKIWYDQ